MVTIHLFICKFEVLCLFYALVAQWIRAQPSEGWGRTFESSQARQRGSIKLTKAGCDKTFNAKLHSGPIKRFSSLAS